MKASNKNNTKTKKINIKNINKTDSFWFYIFIVLAALSFFNLSLYLNSRPKISYAKADTSEGRVLVWQSFLSLHPDYLEGWIELGKLNFAKGNKTEAKNNLDKAIKINPNSEAVEDFKKLF